jgi:hypothetical protein
MVAGLAVAIAVAIHVVVTGADVKVEYDKAFDFKPVRTWGWNPQGPGDVKMARTANDDPEAMRRRAEPIIVDAIAAELSKRGLEAATGKPDIFVTYYLLLTIGSSAQTFGQFVPSVPEWGIPLFPPATQSLQVMNQGSLVLDLSANGNVVWRGVAQAQVKTDADSKKRESILRDAVRDLVRKYPPR